MLDGLRKLDWAPRSVHRKARAVAKAIREMEAEIGREARDVEVADRMGMKLEGVSQASSRTRPVARSRASPREEA